MVSDKALLSSVAMVCIAGLESIALYLGFDGTILTLSLTSIAGLGGYSIGKIRTTKGVISDAK